jgi:hypothetical protein
MFLLKTPGMMLLRQFRSSIWPKEIRFDALLLIVALALFTFLVG